MTRFVVKNNVGSTVAKDKTQHDLSIVLETFEDTVEEPVYEDVEFTL